MRTMRGGKCCPCRAACPPPSGQRTRSGTEDTTMTPKRDGMEKDDLWLVGLSYLCTEREVYNRLNRKEKRIMWKTMKKMNLNFDDV